MIKAICYIDRCFICLLKLEYIICVCQHSRAAAARKSASMVSANMIPIINSNDK